MSAKAIAPGVNQIEGRQDIPYHLDNVSDSSSTLHEVISELEIRLQPVLSPGDDRAEKMGPEPHGVKSELGTRLLDIHVSLRQGVNRIREVVDRLEL